jgi:transcription elongation factor GreA
LENKIKEARRVLQDSRTIDNPESNDFAVLGSLVAIREEGGPEEVYELVGPLEANPEYSRINVTSPLGSALYGHMVGEEVQVQTPSGTSYKVTLFDISTP